MTLILISFNKIGNALSFDFKRQSLLIEMKGYLVCFNHYPQGNS